MTLIDPNQWHQLEKELLLLRDSGKATSEAIRMVFDSHRPGLLHLQKAISEAYDLSTRDAARLIAKEISTRN